ncbi:radical SAM protein [Coprococcus sp. AF19-8AC]|uniref:radical SAM protein n=1 Tax=Coprococcus sp. AF19-8AC TaxID=2293090 RepID=UPI000E7714B4|nr:radical SAM protein [Coprococcus sp. AF19-8AC]RJV44675.1 radical SAM protein [Coprococcus sp. AF19-8AC]
MNRYPEIINLEIMSRCNLKCIHCKLQHQTTEANNKWMSLEDFIKYADRIREFIIHANEFMFSSVEPLLHPELFSMMDYVSSINSQMEFPIQTNGMFLNEEIVRELRKRNVPWISVALDGINEKQLAFLKKGTSFSTVINNLKVLRALMPKSCIIRTVFVSNTENINTLPNYIYFCKELGIDAIDVNGLFCYDEKLQKYALYSNEGNDQVEMIFENAKKIGDKLGIQVQLPLLTPEFVGCEWNKILCIDGDGNVNPCVMLAQKIPFYFLGGYTHGQIVRFGNIFKMDIKEIWNSGKCIEFHKCLQSKEAQDICKYCAEGYGVVCSNR